MPRLFAWQEDVKPFILNYKTILITGIAHSISKIHISMDAIYVPVGIEAEVSLI